MPDVQRLDVLKALADERDPVKLRRRFLTLLMSLQNVERGSIWIRTGDIYECVEAAGSQSGAVRGIRLVASKPSIVGWVIENGRMTVAEPGKDERHNREVESALSVKSTRILCFPLTLRDGRVFGAVQIIDTTEGGASLNLDPEYLGLLQDLVDICAISLEHSLAIADQREENRKLKETLQEMRGREMVTGTSRAFAEVLKILDAYAATDYPVLLLGESGTGKELLARGLHRRSRRRGKPFLVQNCSAIPATLLESELFGYRKGAFTGATGDKIGLFEAADGGTLFLDEIGDMDLALQAKLLRVLQEGEVKPLGASVARKVDVRIVAATHRDLESAVAERAFRQDLYFRLRVLPLRLPPLRERREDIPALLDHFLLREAARLNITPRRPGREALARLVAHEWPGNVRELENLAKRLTAMPGPEIILPASVSAVLDERGLSAPLDASPAAPEPVAPDPAFAGTSLRVALEGKTWEDMERDYALALLARYRWNVSRAARAAGLNRSTFDSRLRRLGISKADVD